VSNSALCAHFPKKNLSPNRASTFCTKNSVQGRERERERDIYNIYIYILILFLYPTFKKKNLYTPKIRDFLFACSERK
jgi:hypothetical protein